MINSIKSQLADWKYGRSIIKCFIIMLSDADLDKPLPRKGLNTIRKQCEELVQIESCYVSALKAKIINFKYKLFSDTSKNALIAQMDMLDNENEKLLNEFNGDETINWFGETWNVHQHLSAMIGHEQMHIGQIIAFCYATGIKIPNKITKTMSLNG